MTVYVDDAFIPYRGMRMCHLISDEAGELHAMAAAIGVSRIHWQAPGPRSGSHYDICKAKRELAIARGAVTISFRQAGAMDARRRATGHLGDPTTAVAWLRQHVRDKRAPKKA